MRTEIATAGPDPADDARGARPRRRLRLRVPAGPRGLAGAGLKGLCLAMLLAAGAAAQSPGPGAQPAAGTTAAAAEAPRGVAYSVTLAGELPGDARDLFEEASQLQRQIDRLPRDTGLLMRRARDDAATLTQILKSMGYFNAAVEVELREEQSPVEVILTSHPGRLFVVSSIEIRFVNTASPPQLPPDILAQIGLQTGMPAVSSEILGAENRLGDWLNDHGHPYARVVNRDATIILSEAVMDLVLDVSPGPPIVFGRVEVEGTDRLEPDYILERVPWAEGQAYDAGQVTRFRDELAQTGLFNLVTAAPPRRPPEDGSAPVTIRVEEAPPRSIGAGAFYSTADGPGVRAFWEHRNLLGMGQHLRLAGVLSQLANTAEASFRWPWFLQPRQTLALEAGYGDINTEAYDVRGARAYGGLERPLWDKWKLSVGISGERSRVESPEGRQNVRLAGFPVKLERDSSNNLLNPTEGSRLTFEVIPYFGEAGSTLTFVRGRAEGSLYLPLDEAQDFVLASRVQVGSMLGETRGTIPADKRFYLGGAGSLRGYKYQSVSPLNKAGQPIGGKSMFAATTELRWRFMDNFGIVPFVDAGQAFDNPYPDFDEELQWAAGLGFRYYTSIGPARLDLAFPLNRRSIDRSFEFYVSLGQAF